MHIHVNILRVFHFHISHYYWPVYSPPYMTEMTLPTTAPTPIKQSRGKFIRGDNYVSIRKISVRQCMHQLMTDSHFIFEILMQTFGCCMSFKLFSRIRSKWNDNLGSSTQKLKQVLVLTVHQMFSYVGRLQQNNPCSVKFAGSLTILSVIIRNLNRYQST